MESDNCSHRFLPGTLGGVPGTYCAFCGKPYSMECTVAAPQAKETSDRGKGGVKPHPNKYGASQEIVAGIEFDSRKEARRYEELSLQEAAGEIRNLRLKVVYVFEYNGVRIGQYTSDFVYEENGVLVVEDVKSEATRKIRDYPLRKKLLKAFYGIDITEV